MSEGAFKLKPLNPINRGEKQSSSPLGAVISERVIPCKASKAKKEFWECSQVFKMSLFGVSPLLFSPIFTPCDDV